MFYCLYHSVMINESIEKLKTVFCCFKTIKNIVALLSSSNFPTKLIYKGEVVLIYLDKSCE